MSDTSAKLVLPHNGSRISGEPLLKSSGEGTQGDASRHEPSYPEPEGRRIEGGEARDGHAQGSSVCSRLLCVVDRRVSLFQRHSSPGGSRLTRLNELGRVAGRLALFSADEPRPLCQRIVLRNSRRAGDRA